MVNAAFVEDKDAFMAALAAEITTGLAYNVLVPVPHNDAWIMTWNDVPMTPASIFFTTQGPRGSIFASVDASYNSMSFYSFDRLPMGVFRSPALTYSLMALRQRLLRSRLCLANGECNFNSLARPTDVVDALSRVPLARSFLSFFLWLNPPTMLGMS